MRVPLSEVKTICTGSELALVRASRKPQFERITLAEAKKSVLLARKLFDKWQDQNRGQARTRSRRVGFGELDNRTQLKVRIFQEALQDFELRVSQLEKAGSAATGKKSTGKSSTGTPKKVRTINHRATRAAVRAQIAEKESVLNAKSGANKKRSSKPKSVTTSSAPRTKAQVKMPTPVAKKKKAQRPTKPASAAAQERLSVQPENQLIVATAAKQSRVTRSGVTTRQRGHVSARGRRAQGRRDSKNS